MHILVENLLKGDRRSAARLISLVENDDQEKNLVLSELYEHTGKAYVIGLTGSPGAGKSSLTDKLTEEIRKQGLTVAIIAVDPTSPFTGGAILGDRIRMQNHALDPGVFIRSMGTRGSLGGLSYATNEAVKVLDAFGRDIVIIETVGVGQSELDIMNTADTTVVVLTPGAGDSIQTIKAGIMEIADVFAVNKADMDGSERVILEVGAMLDMQRKMEWRPPIVPTVTLNKGSGVENLWKAILDHKAFMEANGKLSERRKERLKSEVLEILNHDIKKMVWEHMQQTGHMDSLLKQVEGRELNPYSAAQLVLKSGLVGTKGLG